ncbi:MAG: hypothetical protein ABT20_03505 [Rubrivivax sp. SCN 70-15]|nr:MAG: hypothetical protein ABT20_03505 [Rubrivivax sp. SCN 70-15]
MDDFAFAPPPFRPDEALMRLKKDLRELGLAEREGRFERRGVAIAKAAVEGSALQAAVVKKPSRSSPEWSAKTLKSGTEVREFVADLKKKLAGWGDRDD